MATNVILLLRAEGRGESSMEVVSAVTNKSVRTVYSLLIHGAFYSPHYS